MIGFGEAASVLSKPFCERGARVCAYDVLLERHDGRAALLRRCKTEGVRFCPLPEAVADAEFVFSLVTTQSAVSAAQKCAAVLKPTQTYVDLNSTSPKVKLEIDRIVRESGAQFVDGAILGAIGATGERTRILYAGKTAPAAAETCSRLGWNVTYYHPAVGAASTFKMLRSIFSKGLEALLIEFLLAGKMAGIEKDLWDDVTEFMSGNPFQGIADNWIRTHGQACERRFHEMAQVLETMEHVGVHPLMTKCTTEFFRRSTELGLPSRFPQKPESMDEVIHALQRLTSGSKQMESREEGI